MKRRKGRRRRNQHILDQTFTYLRHILDKDNQTYHDLIHVKRDRSKVKCMTPKQASEEDKNF